MNRRSIVFAVVLLSTAFADCRQAVAGLLFRDDFEDGSAFDGKPVNWAPGLDYFEPTTAEVQDGNYLIRSSSIDLPFPNSGIHEGDSFVEEIAATSVTIRTQARCPEGVACYVGVMSRYAYLESGTDGGNLHGEIENSGDLLMHGQRISRSL